jgi:RNA polymerase sigma factor (sigma-70 family)
MSNDRQRGARAPNTTASRNDAIGQLYERSAGGLRRAVSSRITAPAVVVDDACQTAWARLCARADVDVEDPRVTGWLLTTAVREAWRQAGRQQAQIEAAHSNRDDEDGLAPAAETAGPLELALEHEHTRELGERLGVLNDRERRFLGLQALGLTYREIAQLAGVSARTVDRLIARGRRKLYAAANDT